MDIVRRRLRDVFVNVVLGASVYLGFENTDDIANTITIAQRLIGVTATLYALTALAALYAYWCRLWWLAVALRFWAVLVVSTAVLASVVYGGLGGVNIGALAVALVLVWIVLWASKCGALAK